MPQSAVKIGTAIALPVFLFPLFLLPFQTRPQIIRLAGLTQQLRTLGFPPVNGIDDVAIALQAAFDDAESEAYAWLDARKT